MKASYLVRFDDICPAMNWEVWERIEEILLENNVKPFLAVVPDNKDKKLDVAPANPRFWDRVRQWQKSGWTIGIHGYQHTYTSNHPGIIGLNLYSEFAGLPAEEQESKLLKGLEIFRREAVNPVVWIAPAHSFDETTVSILKNLGIEIISDGFFLFPHRDSRGMLWIPQQLWGFRSMLCGVWTVCYHHNDWSKEDLSHFRNNIKAYAESVTNLDEILNDFGYRRQNRVDHFFSSYFLSCIKAKKSIQKFLGMHGT